MAPLQCSEGSYLTQQMLCSEPDSRCLFTAGQVSFHQLSKGLLSRCYDDLPPPTQQGFAEPLLPWLSKDLLSLTQQGYSVLGWLSLRHKLSKDLLSLPWILMYNTQAQCITTESDSLSHSPRTQQRKAAESGSRHMAQGLLAPSHIEFLIAGEKAVLMIFTIQ